MTEPDTMTYIRAGSCVRTCSSMRIYVWPDAYIRVDLCHRMCSPIRRQKDLDVFQKDGDVFKKHHHLFGKARYVFM